MVELKQLNKCCRRNCIKWVRVCCVQYRVQHRTAESLLLLFEIEDEHCKINGHAQIRMQNLTIINTLMCAHCTYAYVFESYIKAIHLFDPIQYDPWNRKRGISIYWHWRFCVRNHEYFSSFAFLLNQLWMFWRKCLETVEKKNLRIMIRAERICEDKFESLWLGIR